MIELGKKQKLTVIKKVDFGVYLADVKENAEDKVLLPIKQVPEDTVQRTPYMDANGDVQYNESIVKQLPQIPRRKDRV